MATSAKKEQEVEIYGFGERGGIGGPLFRKLFSAGAFRTARNLIDCRLVGGVAHPTYRLSGFSGDRTAWISSLIVR